MTPLEKIENIGNLFSEIPNPISYPLKICSPFLPPMSHFPIVTDSSSQTGFCPRELMD